MTNLKELGQQAGEKVKAGARELTHHAAPGLEALARFGYVSKGVVYATIGLLALSVALGRGGTTTDAKGALLRLEDLPAGGLLLWVLVLGLVGYALWQLLRGVLNPERQSAVKRVAYLISAVFNLGIAVFAGRLALAGHATRNANSTQQTAHDVLLLPGGRLLLGVAAVVLLVVAGVQLYSAYGQKFMKRTALTDLGARYSEQLTRVGQLGIAARGITVGIVGVFLLIAALRGNSQQVLGSAQVLTWLHQQPAGSFLLGIVALGTLCYGLWCFVQARYRRIRVEG